MPDRAPGKGSKPGGAGITATPLLSAAERRFRDLDRYRVEREWQRFEGTAQRDLLRELRVRYLQAHAPPPEGPVVDVGSGPGRFSTDLASAGQRLLLLDLSDVALHLARDRRRGVGAGASSSIAYLRGNGRAPPVRWESCSGVALLGNLLGFAGNDARALVESSARLLRTGGLLTLELAPGEGELSAYLRRLPPSAVARLLAAPVAAVRPRVEREGFVPAPRERAPRSQFRRLLAAEVQSWLDPLGLRLESAAAIAPAMGADPECCTACRSRPKAWAHLIELEEAIGAEPKRWTRCSNLLASFRRA